jgi:filamentous hemagglutinin
MGGSTSGLYSGTQGSESATTATLPPHDSQLKHIFRAQPGHLPDTPENRQLLLDLANTPLYYRGTDKWGNRWYAQDNPDGSQLWVEIYNGVIGDGGLNQQPQPWDDESGLKVNIIKNPIWVQKKKGKP